MYTATQKNKRKGGRPKVKKLIPDNAYKCKILYSESLQVGVVKDVIKCPDAYINLVNIILKAFNRYIDNKNTLFGEPFDIDNLYGINLIPIAGLIEVTLTLTERITQYINAETSNDVSFCYQIMI